ncbi:hypothetical protein J4Q44_G00387960 [Coregonus suidteri]|uniref:Uncharacterized protein n=1 Tax=Coregonus suidteri TaxID=861788 RepID=A0AAN8KKR9_9TELE
MLVLVIAGVLVTWKMWRKHKDNKAMDQTTNTSVQDPFPANGDDVTYSTVVPKRRNQRNVQTKEEPDDNVVYSSLSLQLDPFPANGDDVTYSTVVPKRRNQRNVQTKTEPDDNVVYSSLALHHTGAYRVSVKTGGSSTIPCPYIQEYKTHRTDKASIADDINQQTITVTMPDLEPEDSVHIAVRRQTTTQSPTTMTTTQAPTTEQSSFSPTAEPVQTDNTVQGPEEVKEKDTMRLSATQAPTTEQSSFSPTAEPVQTDNTVQGPEGGKEKDTMSSIDLKVLLIPLGMLVVVIAGVLVTWKMWRKHKDNKAMDQTTNTSVQDPFPANGDDVTYSTVVPKRRNQLNVQTKTIR